MPNTVNTVKSAQQIIARLAAGMLADKMQFIKTIDKEPYETFKGENGYNAGDTVSISKPARFIANNTQDVTSAIQDVEESRIPLALTGISNVAVNFTSNEIATDFDLRGWAKRVVEPAMTTIQNDIESKVLISAKNAVPNAVGNPGSSLFDTDMMLAAREVMNKGLCPMDEKRYALLDSSAMRKAVNARKGLFQASDEVAKQYKQGYMGQSDGFTFLENNLLPTHTNGNDVTGVTVKTTVSSQGTSTVVLTGVTANTGTITAGTVITIADVFAVHPTTYQTLDNLQQFTVVTGGTADGSSDLSITVYPALRTTGTQKTINRFPTASDVVTFVGAASTGYTNSLAYHQSAFRFVSAPLVLPGGLDMAAQETVDGITVRVLRGFDIKTSQLIQRFDVLYGFCAPRPEWACRLYK
jgi:P22 coat protein - gene protein 5